MRSNSRRFVPSQADEEAHQLSYLQKHLGNLVSLLAEPVEGEGDESLVCETTTYPYLMLSLPCFILVIRVLIVNIRDNNFLLVSSSFVGKSLILH